MFVGSEELERDVEFEVVGEAPDKAPPPQAKQEEVNSITNGNKDSAQPSTSSKGKHLTNGLNGVDSFVSCVTHGVLPHAASANDDDDIMIVDSDEEEGASSGSAGASSGVKRKHSDTETGETSSKRPRTGISSAAETTADEDDDDIIALD